MGVCSIFYPRMAWKNIRRISDLSIDAFNLISHIRLGQSKIGRILNFDADIYIYIYILVSCLRRYNKWNHSRAMIIMFFYTSTRNIRHRMHWNIRRHIYKNVWISVKFYYYSAITWLAMTASGRRRLMQISKKVYMNCRRNRCDTQRYM
jgi:hypothetical protein